MARDTVVLLEPPNAARFAFGINARFFFCRIASFSRFSSVFFSCSAHMLWNWPRNVIKSSFGSSSP